MEKPQIIKARSPRKQSLRFQQFPHNFPGLNLNPGGSASHSHQGSSLGLGQVASMNPNIGGPLGHGHGHPIPMGANLGVHHHHQGILQSNPFVPIQRSNFGEEMMEVGSAASHV